MGYARVTREQELALARGPLPKVQFDDNRPGVALGECKSAWVCSLPCPQGSGWMAPVLGTLLTQMLARLLFLILEIFGGVAANSTDWAFHCELDWNADGQTGADFR